MENITQFANQKYLNLETYRKNGQVMLTPVWFVQDGDVFYIRTVADSGKVKRVRNNGKVRVMPCGQSGEPLGMWVDAHAEESTDAATFARVRELLIAKYGAMVEMFEKQTYEKGLKYTVIKIIL